VMLSDAQHMTDGETELMKGDGTTMKVRSPGMVSNVMILVLLVMTADGHV